MLIFYSCEKNHVSSHKSEKNKRKHKTKQTNKNLEWRARKARFPRRKCRGGEGLEVETLVVLVESEKQNQQARNQTRIRQSNGEDEEM